MAVAVATKKGEEKTMFFVPVEPAKLFLFWFLCGLRKTRKEKKANPPTPYSMNSLFSEFFRKFGGVFLKVCETI